jgi:hypothetical protein
VRADIHAQDRISRHRQKPLAPRGRTIHWVNDGSNSAQTGLPKCPREADIHGARWHVSNVPTPDSCAIKLSDLVLFDHLVGAGEQRRRHSKVERLCCLKIDNQLVFCWRLNRQVGRYCALQHTIYVACRALITIIGNWSIRGKTSV